MSRDKLTNPGQGKISRRAVLKLGSLAVGGFSLDLRRTGRHTDEGHQRFGRICQGPIDLKARPSYDSQTLGRLNEDTVVPWLREVVGTHTYRFNQRWVETPQGFLWSGQVQPVEDRPNSPLENLPESSLGPGIWVEVTVPWVDLHMANPPARSPWLKENATPRLYFSQILWVDEIQIDQDTGQYWYRLNEKYGYGDIFLAASEAFRPLIKEELAPINPDIEDKRILVNVTDQTLGCFEEGREVYFCRISTGAKFDASGNPVDEWSTPLGSHPIWRKIISLHMSGGTTGGGYDLPGIGYTTLFIGNGVAIHSTFWHNNFGVAMSHGCVNASPKDAKWIFRWCAPEVPFDPGDLTISMPGGTRVEVIEN